MTGEKKGIVWVQGQSVWVPHPDAGYARGTIMSVVSESQLSIRLDEFDQTIEVNPVKEGVESILVDKETLLATEDLTKLPDLHRPSLLDALNQRFQKDKIYTYTGHILIAINPFKDLDLYGPKLMLQYFNHKTAGSSTVELPPHVYNIANNSFLSMLDNDGKNQSILVSGESGAGKTVTTKIVLDYLTFVSQRKESKSSAKNVVCEKVLQSNPVLEAFGNAKTLRNDNSSRFGKLIQLKFGENNFDVKVSSTLVACDIDTYLLEKARVMNHGNGERNFHIFYELHAGLSEKEKEELEMPHVEDCAITNAHDRRVYRSDVEDKDQWRKTLLAMKTVGLSDEEIRQLQRLVVAVMHLGEIVFEEVSGSTADAAKVSEYSKASAAAACRLLEIPVDALEKALCSRVLNLRDGSQLQKPHNLQQAAEARNAIAMSLYERAFLWLVWKTNKSMSSTLNSKKTQGKRIGKFTHGNTISVLDIFGFEVFQKNSFEQMFINYANEVLQQLFNEFVFKIEQQMYEAEGIDWTKITFPDNSECIELIEHKKVGLLKMLDDECLMPKGSDSALHDKIKRIVCKKFSVVKVDGNRQSMQMLFTITHFAGDVEYTTESFCLKNKNELRQEQIDCIRCSSNLFFQTLLPSDPAKASGAANASYFDEVTAYLERMQRLQGRKDSKQLPQGGHQKSTNPAASKRQAQRLQQSTVGNNFKSELNIALEKIKASQLHFVRCIKPNDRNAPDDLDSKRTLEQLNYSGVLEAVRISRMGYSSRFMFKDFVARFAILLPANYKRVKGHQNNAFKGCCLDLVEMNQLVKYKDYQIGYSKVFLKSNTYGKLESMKRDRQNKAVLLLQRNMKVFLLKSSIARRVKQRKLRLEEEARKKRGAESSLMKEQAMGSKQLKHYVTMQDIPKVQLESDLSQLHLKTAHSRSGANRRSRQSEKLAQMDQSSRSTNARSRRPMRAKQPAHIGKTLEHISRVMEDFVAHLQGHDMPELLEEDGPLIGGVLVCAALVFFNFTGVDAKAVVNFMMISGSAIGIVLFLVEMKIQSDRRKKDLLSIGRQISKRATRKSFQYEEDGLDSRQVTSLRKGRGLSRGRSGRSLRSHDKKRRSRTSSKGNVRKAASRKSRKGNKTLRGSVRTTDENIALFGDVEEPRTRRLTEHGTEGYKVKRSKAKARRGTDTSVSTAVTSNTRTNQMTLRSGGRRYRGLSVRLPKKES